MSAWGRPSSMPKALCAMTASPSQVGQRWAMPSSTRIGSGRSAPAGVGVGSAEGVMSVMHTTVTHAPILRRVVGKARSAILGTLSAGPRSSELHVYPVGNVDFLQKGS